MKIKHHLLAVMLFSCLSAHAIIIKNDTNDRIHFNVYSAETLQEFGANEVDSGKHTSWGDKHRDIDKLNVQFWTVLPFMAYQRGVYNVPQCVITITGYENLTYRPKSTISDACKLPPINDN